MKRKVFTAIGSLLIIAGLVGASSEIVKSWNSANPKFKIQTITRNPPGTVGPTANSKTARGNSSYVDVFGMRKFPYPYKAMLAIASDADHETLRKFNLAHEFLNTTNMTPMGPGLGLDISDSFFMYNGSNVPSYVDHGKLPLSDQFTYFKGTSGQRYGADIMDHYIHDGWLDGIHTFGDFSMVNEHQTKFTRQLAIQAISALKSQGDHVSVWIDHGNMSNVDNFGAYGLRNFYNYQQGANPKSRYYHTDLTVPYGIQFVWPGRDDQAFGRTSMIYPITLPDGQKVWGFWRLTDTGFTEKTGVKWIWSTYGLPDALTASNLMAIENSNEYTIIGQHLSGDNDLYPIPAPAQHALRRLAQQYYKGNILVARTSRLLSYNVAQQYIRFNVTRRGGQAVIHITSIADPVYGSHVPTVSELRGVTFYTSNPKGTIVDIGDTAVSTDMLQYNPNDGYAPSIGIKWYPAETANYSINRPGIF